jgi:hypothetical protein
MIMQTVTLELTLPQDVYFALQAEGFDRNGLQKQAQLDLFEYHTVKMTAKLV